MPIKHLAATLLTFCLTASAAAFDPAGWTTSRDFPLLGSAKAVKGGELRSTWLNFPPTLRTNGPNSNTMEARSLHAMMYESLVGLHPETLDYIPALADYWKISGALSIFI